MANENNSNIGFGNIVKIAFGVTIGALFAKKASDWVDEKAAPYVGKKFKEGVEYLKNIKAKKTEDALKVDDAKTE